MSYNPWPLVIVALGSLGFLANSMAQNNNRFETLDPERAGQRYSDFQELEDTSRSEQESLESFDQFETRSRGLTRDPEIRREDAPSIKITDVQPQTRFDRTSSSFVPRRAADTARAEEPVIDPRRETRVAQNTTRSDGGGLPLVDFGARRRSNAVTSSPSTRITQDDIDRAYLEGDFRATMPTAVSREHKDLISTQNVNPSVDVPFRRKSQNTAGGTLGGVLKNGQDKLENALERATQPRSVPFWLTLGLFISLPANLFFGWIAMSMHARYQDLLADMQASESRLSRESRRRRVRSEDRDRDERRARSSSRERDEEAFLHGGIEA